MKHTKGPWKVNDESAPSDSIKPSAGFIPASPEMHALRISALKFRAGDIGPTLKCRTQKKVIAKVKGES